MDAYTELNEDEYLEMASLSHKATGIEKVVIWAGPNPYDETFRIKVSNTGDYRGKNLFTLTLPDYQVLGPVNEQLISSEVLEKIKRWCDKNRQAIVDYSTYKTSTDEFIQRLVPLTGE